MGVPDIRNLDEEDKESLVNYIDVLKRLKTRNREYLEGGKIRKFNALIDLIIEGLEYVINVYLENKKKIGSEEPTMKIPILVEEKVEDLKKNLINLNLIIPNKRSPAHEKTTAAHHIINKL